MFSSVRPVPQPRHATRAADLNDTARDGARDSIGGRSAERIHVPMQVAGR